MSSRSATALEPGKLNHRLAWSLLANGLASLNVLITAFLVARWLGAELFGRLALLLSAQMVLTTLVTSSLGQVAIKLTAELRQTDPGRLASIRTLLDMIVRWVALLVLMAGLLAPDVLTEALFGKGAADTLTRFAIPMLIFAALAALQQGFIAGLGAFRYLAFVNVLRFVVTIAALGALVPTYGLAGAVVALGIGGVATWVGGEVVVRRLLPVPAMTPTWAEAKGEVGVLTGFALPTWLSGTLFVIAAWLGNVILSRRPDGLVEVGLFTAASQLGRSLLLFVPSALAAPFLVEIAAAFGRGERAAAGALFRRSAVLTAGSALIPAIVLAIFGSRLLGLYGASFVEGYSVLLVILAGTVLAALTVSVNATLLAFGRAWTVTTVTFVWTLVFALTLWAVLGRGAMGLAIAYLCAYAAQVALTVPLATRALRTRSSG